MKHGIFSISTGESPEFWTINSITFYQFYRLISEKKHIRKTTWRWWIRKTPINSMTEHRWSFHTLLAVELRCTPPKTNGWNPKMKVWKMIFKGVIFRFHVSFNIGSFPQVGGENKKYLKPPPSMTGPFPPSSLQLLCSFLHCIGGFGSGLGLLHTTSLEKVSQVTNKT